MRIAGEHHDHTFHIGGTVQLMHLPWGDDMQARGVHSIRIQIDHVRSAALGEKEQFMKIVAMNAVPDLLRSRKDRFHLDLRPLIGKMVYGDGAGKCHVRKMLIIHSALLVGAGIGQDRSPRNAMLP